MTLEEALRLRERELVALVGAGGKTTLMYRLADEIRMKGGRVLTTSTTKMKAPPAPVTTCFLRISEGKQGITELLEHTAVHASSGERHVTAVSREIEPGKYRGLSPEIVGEIYRKGIFSHIIVEADGARGRSLKVPADHEPVVPRESTVVLGLVGADVLGQPFGPELCFRCEKLAAAIGKTPGMLIEPRDIFTAVTYRMGMRKGIPPAARFFVVFNKVLTAGREAELERLSRELLARGNELREGGPPIAGTLLAELQASDPVYKCYLAETPNETSP